MSECVKVLMSPIYCRHFQQFPWLTMAKLTSISLYFLNLDYQLTNGVQYMHKHEYVSEYLKQYPPPPPKKKNKENPFQVKIICFSIPKQTDQIFNLYMLHHVLKFSLKRQLMKHYSLTYYTLTMQSLTRVALFIDITHSPCRVELE